MITHDEFIFNAHILGYNIKYLIIDNVLHILNDSDYTEYWKTDIQKYITEHNPLFPEFISFDCEIDLIDYNQVLPNNITFAVELYLYDDNSLIETLPENLRSNGDLVLSYSNIREIPESIKLGASLNVRGSRIEKLPDNLVVPKDLDVSSCLLLKQLPENLTVNGNLYMNEHTQVPSSITVNGKISIGKHPKW